MSRQRSGSRSVVASSRRQFLVGSGALLAAGFTPSHSRALAAAPAVVKRGGEITFLQSGTLRSLDPQSFYAGFEMRFWQHIYDPLIALSPTGDKIVPRLATSWSVAPDHRTWTFKLRKGVKFSNGDDFTAHAVKATFDRGQANAKSPYNFVFRPIELVETPDPLTVVIRTKEVAASLLNDLTLVFIGHPNIAKAGSEPWNEGFGTGPFKVGEFKSQQFAILEGRSDYWEAGLPKLRKLTFRRVQEESARIAGVMAEEAQVAEALPAQVMQQLKGHATLKPTWVPLWNAVILGVNPSRPALKAPKVRQAVNYAIDRDALTGSVMQSGRPMSTYPPRGVLGYDSSLPANPYNPSRAKQLLQEAGASLGTELKLNFGIGQLPKIDETSQFVANELRKVGCKVAVVGMDFAAEQTARFSGNYDFFITDSNVVTGDPQRYFNERVLGDPYKAGWAESYKGEPALEMLREAGRTLEASKRDDLYKKVQRRLWENPPVLYLFQGDWPMVYHKNLVDPPMDPTRLFSFRAVGWSG